MAEWSETHTFLDGEWFSGNRPILGPRSHAFWLGSSVFDGARAFEGVTPDLDVHCERVNRSAKAMWLKPLKSAQEMIELTREGLKRFKPGAALYIRPMYWAETSGVGAVAQDPESTRFLLTIYETPMPDVAKGVSITRAQRVKPLPTMAPIEAKAGCLYPNNARALLEARARGFDNCVMFDGLGNVAETATANLFLVKDGVVKTPAANGAFLNGITRQRVIKLLTGAGVAVVETTLAYADLLEADEIFMAGNFGKVTPVGGIDGRALPLGPLYAKARALYWEFAHAG
ncbi:MAG: branched-chain amino acid aminotransferase [Pseudomonadota bacterium]|nr:branched-chain amino acid aminotransferase [Pseudomonadota bacterium]